MLIIKVKYQDDVRRTNVKDYDNLSVSKLRSLLNDLFAIQHLPSNFVIKYLDDENDLVTISSEIELQEALTAASLNNEERPILRLTIVIPKEETCNKKSSSSSSSSSCQKQEFSLQGISSLISDALHSAGPELQTIIHSLDVSNLLSELTDNINVSTNTFEGNNKQHHHHRHHPHPQKVNDDNNNNLTLPYHHAVCDHCQANIYGIRFKCGNCLDYDLCEKCEVQATAVHDASHLFIKIRKPIGYTGRRCLLPELHSSESPKCHQQGRCGRGGRGLWRHAHAASPSVVPQPQEEKSEEAEASDNHVPFPGAPEHWRRRYCATFPRPCMQRLRARFVKDVAIEDGTVVAPGQKFTKIWRITNAGASAWPENTRLTFISGDSFAAPGFEECVVIASNRCYPGETVDIAVDMIAPQQEGRYVSNWRLCTPEGISFGQRFWSDIIVKKQSNDDNDATNKKQEEVKPIQLLKLRPIVKKQEEPKKEEEKKSEVSSPLLKIRQPEASPSPSTTTTTVKEEKEKEDKKKPLSKYENKVALLVSMGFADVETNRAVLNFRRGNVAAAVNDLVVSNSGNTSQ